MSVAEFSELSSKLDGVEGWLYEGEAWALSLVTKTFPADHPLFVVEIGSWKGRSAISLCFGMRDREGQLYAVDPHAPSVTGHTKEYGECDSFAEFQRNIAHSGYSERVHPIRALSADAPRLLPPVPIDVLFLDGAHEYEQVLDDIRRYGPLLAAYAVVAFNDPTKSGVHRALSETVLRNDSAFFDGRLIQNTLFFAYDRSRRARDFAAGRSTSKALLRHVLRLRLLLQTVRPWLPISLVRIGHRVSARLTGASLDHT